MTARRTDPTTHLYAGAVYVNAASTDIRKRFEAMRQQAQKPKVRLAAHQPQPAKKTA